MGGWSLMVDLTEAECATLLRANAFGRLAVITETGPVILPVNYAFAPPHIVMRTADGLKIDEAPLARVCFEIDAVDESVGRGWSVVAKGFAREISHAIDPDSEQLRRLPIAPLAPGPKDRWLAIEIDELTGRRLGSLPDPAWPAGV